MLRTRVAALVLAVLAALACLGAAAERTLEAAIQAKDAGAATQAIQDFVSTYNTLLAGISNQFTFNAATNTAGPLAGDGALRCLRRLEHPEAQAQCTTIGRDLPARVRISRVAARPSISGICTSISTTS